VDAAKRAKVDSRPTRPRSAPAHLTDSAGPQSVRNIFGGHQPLQRQQPIELPF